MRIGITGATGFIGRAFSALAVAGGHEFVAFTRGRSSSVLGAAQTYRLGVPEGALQETRLDALVHLAGENLMGLWTARKMEGIRSSRVDLTRRLVASLATWRPENRPKVLVSASGVGFYGDRGDEELDERSSVGTGFLARLCVEWEAAAAEAAALGIRVVHLRTGLVLGHGGGPYPPMRRAFRLGLGGRFGPGRQWMPWIHEQDEAGLILWAVENEAVQGALNLCAPNPVTNADFTRALGRSLRRPAFCHVPAFALRLLMPKMADEMLLSGQRAIPRMAREMGYRFAFSKLEDALASLA